MALLTQKESTAFGVSGVTAQASQSAQKVHVFLAVVWEATLKELNDLAKVLFWLLFCVTLAWFVNLAALFYYLFEKGTCK